MVLVFSTNGFASECMGFHILPEEMMVHNQVGDAWVSLFGLVMDVSDIAHPTRSLASRVVLAHAGNDLSHLFDVAKEEDLGFVLPGTGLRLAPLPILEESNNALWWCETARVRGKLSKGPRSVRVLDMFTGLQVSLQVCEEDTVHRILQRYKIFNSDAEKYTCRADGNLLDLSKTLDENGIKDERDLFNDLGLPEDFYVPAIMLYLQDDFLLMPD